MSIFFCFLEICLLDFFWLFLLIGIGLILSIWYLLVRKKDGYIFVLVLGWVFVIDFKRLVNLLVLEVVFFFVFCWGYWKIFIVVIVVFVRLGYFNVVKILVNIIVSKKGWGDFWYIFLLLFNLWFLELDFIVNIF